MGEKQIPFLFLVLLMWLVAGAFFLKQSVAKAAVVHHDIENTEGTSTTTFAVPAESTDDRLQSIREEALNKALIFYFDVDGDDINLTDAEKSIIEDLAFYVKNVENSELEISGHTDSYGKDSYNFQLSEKRAKLAADLLRNYGVPASRMSTVGYGKTQPLKPNDTQENRIKNRRVEIILR